METSFFREIEAWKHLLNAEDVILPCVQKPSLLLIEPMPKMPAFLFLRSIDRRRKGNMVKQNPVLTLSLQLTVTSLL
jgi:hypothetical protein